MKQLIKSLSGVLAAYPEIQEAYLFGSYARGEAQAHSDIDIAVYVDALCVDDRAASAYPFGFEAELATQTMSALHMNQVDVVVLNNANPLLYHRVLRDGIRLLSRDLKQTTVRESRAISKYCDYLPQLKKVERAFAGRLNEGKFGT